jgi:hypothetical protein
VKAELRCVLKDHVCSDRKIQLIPYTASSHECRPDSQCHGPPRTFMLSRLARERLSPDTPPPLALFMLVSGDYTTRKTFIEVTLLVVHRFNAMPLLKAAVLQIVLHHHCGTASVLSRWLTIPPLPGLKRWNCQCNNASILLVSMPPVHI